jgi:hypothetical protein
MLPAVHALFTLVRELAAGTTVTQVAAPALLVRRHGLAPLAGRAGIGEFREDLIRSTVDWGRMQRDVAPVLAAFAAAGVASLPLKGLSYATTIYAAPAERPMSDADLLVRGDDDTRARAALTSIGFTPSADPPFHHASTWVRDRQVIDLHTSIVGPGRARIDLEAVWQRATDRLDPIDELVFHFIHLARNRMCVPLIHVVDAARLTRRAGGVTAAIDRARAWGVHTTVALAHRFCASILRDDVERPAGWLGPSLHDVALLREPGVARKLAFDVATAGSARQLAARLASYANRLRRVS